MHEQCVAFNNSSNALCAAVTIGCEVFAMRRPSLAVAGHAGPPTTGDVMTSPHATAALAALGQSTRLEIFRLLMRQEPKGLPAGTRPPF